MKNNKCRIINMNWNTIQFGIIKFFDKINFFLQKINFVYIFENYVNRIKL